MLGLMRELNDQFLFGRLLERPSYVLQRKIHSSTDSL
jgi:hypothetical protein